jgi:hypothetical protein
MSGAGFTRRYTFDPGLAEILKIEGVVIIDRDVPGNTTGETTGASCLVAEFEDGPYNTPTEIFGGSDQLATFGGFGFTHDGLPSSNPCARSRKADSSVVPEYWNGNGFLALARKTFPRLFLVRPDTSVGAVSFTKLPSVLGNANFSWDLEPGVTAIFQTAFATTSTATFSAASALLTSAAGTYPTTFVGGESMNVTVDAGTPLQIGPIDITFTSAQSTQAQVVSRINAVLGFSCATAIGGNQTTLAGRVRGNTGSVRVNSVSGALVTTATGFSASTSAIGTGNVGNIDQVSFAEVKSVIEAAVTGAVVDRDANGNLRVSHTTATEILYTTASTADALGIVEAQASQQPTGYAYLYSTAGTYPVTFSSDTLTLGFDGDQNLTVSFTNGSTAQAAVITAINNAFGRTVVTSASATILRFQGRVNGGEVRVVAATANVQTALGLTLRTQTAVANQPTTIPAGTRVRTSAGLEVLTTQTTSVALDSVGPYSVKVRPSLDDGTFAGATAASMTLVADSIPLAAFSATNPLALTAALTEGALDAAYTTAINSTLNASAVTKDANSIWSARQSSAIRSVLRQNAVDASKGLRGRWACVSPPLGTTTRAMAKSTSQAPGVGATASDRVFYCYPGASVFVPQVAARGTSGGAGFTADGFVDLHADGIAASVAGLLPPEQNMGQQTDFMGYVSGVERGNPDVQSLQEPDYESFRKSGIVALRMGDNGPVFQSDVTSYGDINSSKSDGPRRRFADFAEDSLAVIAGPFAKKPMTVKRRSDVFGQFQAFAETLKSPGDPDSSRLFDYVLDAKTGNPPAAIKAGVFRIKTSLGMNPDMLDIVIDATIQRGSVVTTQS